MGGWGGLFLSWGRPSPEQQKACLSAAGGFNYDSSLHGATADMDASEASLTARGFFVNRSRVLLGSGDATFRLARSAILDWKHFAVGWSFVDPATPVAAGARFCVCVKELASWIMMPLQVSYVGDASTWSFGFGSGTLQGHLLAGEERFSVRHDENGEVWFEVCSFSKPAHPLATICYPYVQLRQRFFAQESARAVMRHVATHRSAKAT